MTVRVPPERLAWINQRAKASGKTRTQYVLDRADPEGAPARATKPGDMVRPSTECQHPKGERKIFGWGTVCGACGVRLVR